MAEGIQSASKELLKVPVSATENGEPVDPTSYTVKVAVTKAQTGADIDEGDWKDGDWETIPSSRYCATVLIGPGSSVGQLTKGTWNVFVKITTDIETVIKSGGQIPIV